MLLHHTYDDFWVFLFKGDEIALVYLQVVEWLKGMQNVLFLVFIFQNSFVAIIKTYKANTLWVENSDAISVPDKNTCNWHLPQLERLLHIQNVFTLILMVLMLFTCIAGNIENDDVVSVDVDLFVAHDQFFYS